MSPHSLHADVWRGARPHPSLEQLFVQLDSRPGPQLCTPQALCMGFIDPHAQADSLCRCHEMQVTASTALRCAPAEAV